MNFPYFGAPEDLGPDTIQMILEDVEQAYRRGWDTGYDQGWSEGVSEPKAPKKS